MSNRRKSNKEKWGRARKKAQDMIAEQRNKPVTMHFTENGAKKVNLPDDEKELLKEVPALIHWDNLPEYGRDDIETVGKALMYDDGSQDVVIFEDISVDAKNLIYGLKSQLDHLRVGD